MRSPTVGSHVALVAAFLLALGPVPLQGADVFVNKSNPNCPGNGTAGNPFCTISAAIAAAANGDTIRIAPGTYTENLLISGRTLDLVGTSGKNVTIVDGQASASVARILASSVVSIDGLTLTNGSAYYEGGGIELKNSTLDLTNSALTGNLVAYYGAAIHASQSILTVANTTFTGNTATSGYGGGIDIRNNSTVDISDSTFTGNNGGYAGGAIRSAQSSLTITDSVISGNTVVQNGAGIQAVSTDLTISGCTVSGNTGAVWGGGIQVRAGSTLTMTASTVSGNSSRDGGGIHESNGPNTLEIVGCKITGNTANYYGGGVQIDGANTTLEITNSLIANNTANSPFAGVGAGIMVGKIHGGQTLTLVNSTLSGNTANIRGGGLVNDPPQVGPPCVADVRNSIVWGNTAPLAADTEGTITATYSDIAGGVPGPGNVNIDPQFTSPGTGDYTLKNTSPVCDAGNDALVPAGLITDLAGGPRFVDNFLIGDTGSGLPPVVDMGAYEVGCPSAQPYGAGCPGAGGITPSVLVGPCPLTPGGPITVVVLGGLGGSTAVICLGAAPGFFKVGPCALLVNPLLNVVAVPLGGVGPGNGSITFNGTLPLTTSGASGAIQAFVLDGTPGIGACATNGVHVNIP